LKIKSKSCRTSESPDSMTEFHRKLWDKIIYCEKLKGFGSFSSLEEFLLYFRICDFNVTNEDSPLRKNAIGERIIEMGVVFEKRYI